MSIVEFIGIARSGKTTTAQYLKKKFPSIIYHPERHDLVPENLKGDDFGYSFWYANYCVEEIKEALTKPGVHLFERGIVDHIVIGKTYFEMGWFTKEQLDKYLALLTPYADKNDLTFVFRIPVDVSVQRAKNMGKDVTRTILYINALVRAYNEIWNWYPKVIFLPENATREELEQLTAEPIQKLVK